MSDNSPPGQLAPDNSPLIFRQLAPNMKTPMLRYTNIFYALKVIISWKKKKICCLKYITRPRLTFVAIDCNNRVNTWTWPFCNPVTTFEINVMKQLCCFCFMFWSLPLWKNKHQTQITFNFETALLFLFFVLESSAVKEQTPDANNI